MQNRRKIQKDTLIILRKNLQMWKKHSNVKYAPVLIYYFKCINKKSIIMLFLGFFFFIYPNNEQKIQTQQNNYQKKQGFK